MSTTSIRPVSVPATVARAGSTAGRRTLLALMLTAAFVQLNLQVVIWDLLGIEPEGVNTDPTTFGWILVPATFWALGVWSWLGRRRRTWLDHLTVLWIAMLLVHGLFYAARSGLAAGALAFFSWGMWFSLLFWGANQRRIRLGPLLAALFSFAGLLQAVPALYEYFSGATLFREVTAGEFQVQRLYGINQSVVWLGTQLGLGILATLWFVMSSRRPVVKLLLAGSILIQAVALVLTGGRGPTFFTIVGLGIVMVTASRRRRVHNAGYILIAIPLILVFLAGQAQRSARLDYTLSAVSFSDESNELRWATYVDTVTEDIGSDVFSLVLGHGAGASSFVGRYVGEGELNTESSMLSLVYDLGILGVFVFAAIWIYAVRRGVRGLRGSNRLMVSIFLAIFVVLSLEATVAEPLKAWTLMVYFWGTAAVLVQEYRLGLAASNRPAEPLSDPAEA